MRAALLFALFLPALVPAQQAPTDPAYVPVTTFANELDSTATQFQLPGFEVVSGAATWYWFSNPAPFPDGSRNVSLRVAKGAHCTLTVLAPKGDADRVSLTCQMLHK